LTSSFFGAAAFATGIGEGIEPLGQVVGASACRLVVGVVRRTRGPLGRLPVGAPTWHEWDGPLRAWTTARQRAVARLQEQASVLGGDLVLGVHTQRRTRRVGASRVVEVVLTGTAVRLTRSGKRTVGAPVVATTSPQEFCLLRRMGAEVVGLAGSFSCVHVAAGSQTIQATRRARRSSANQELADLTTGVYEARRLAVARLRAEAKGLDASGVIGVDIAGPLGGHDLRSAEMTVSVHALGTAVRGPTGAKPLSPRLVLGLGGRDA